MCGIAGIVALDGRPIPGIGHLLQVMNELLAHRGPDDEGTWTTDDASVGLAHRRLSIIDVSPEGHQPFVGNDGTVITYNGEIYNYLELRAELEGDWKFRSTSDTEVILAAYRRWGLECIDHFRGMFAFALWDGERMFCARDRLGIKPFYFATPGQDFVFASEVKALLPFLPDVVTDPDALTEYLVFQYPISNRTLFRDVTQLLPGHALLVERGTVRTWRYWDVQYEADFSLTPQACEERLRELVADSVNLHLRSDVPVGAYVSGGIDSSLVAILAERTGAASGDLFHGKFSAYPSCDESEHAATVARQMGATLHQVDIDADDFAGTIERVIYHLDYPVAGPGSFPQYMVSELAAKSVKVVLGGQGGDEIFGGYARYLIAYFEQCIRAAIDGTYRDGEFVVTAESIIPNLGVLREYKPLIEQFWSKGLFGPLDERYFRLVDRSSELADEIDWTDLDRGRVFDEFRTIFNNPDNVRKTAYFDKMTHFDFKCLLPGLLQVEDRMSMAHGLESRVPFLDHPLIEFMATVPADVKFRDGHMKHFLKETFRSDLPASLLDRRDKMGFPVPLHQWTHGPDAPLGDFVNDVFRSSEAQSRPYVDASKVIAHLDEERPFGRKLWGLLGLELWQRQFHDQAHHYRKRLEEQPARAAR
ncbi:MAG: asparagine synthase (glutamine-hydrolyzing) [Acidimicrobiia bacterium]